MSEKLTRRSGMRELTSGELREMYFDALNRECGRALPDRVINLAVSLCAAHGVDPNSIVFSEELERTPLNRVMHMPRWPMPAWCNYGDMAEAIYLKEKET